MFFKKRYTCEELGQNLAASLSSQSIIPFVRSSDEWCTKGQSKVRTAIQLAFFCGVLAEIAIASIITDEERRRRIRMGFFLEIHRQFGGNIETEEFWAAYLHAAEEYSSSIKPYMDSERPLFSGLIPLATDQITGLDVNTTTWAESHDLLSAFTEITMSATKKIVQGTMASMKLV